MNDLCKHKRCSVDKICNPRTGLCVSRTGSVGKKLVSPDLSSVGSAVDSSLGAHLPPDVIHTIKRKAGINDPLQSGTIITTMFHGDEYETFYRITGRTPTGKYRAERLFAKKLREEVKRRQGSAHRMRVVTYTASDVAVPDTPRALFTEGRHPPEFSVWDRRPKKYLAAIERSRWYEPENPYWVQLRGPEFSSR